MAWETRQIGREIHSLSRGAFTRSRKPFSGSFLTCTFIALLLPFSLSSSPFPSRSLSADPLSARPKAGFFCLREKTLCMSSRLKKVALDSDVSSVSTLTRDRVPRETTTVPSIIVFLKRFSSQFRRKRSRNIPQSRVGNNRKNTATVKRVWLRERKTKLSISCFILGPVRVARPYFPRQVVKVVVKLRRVTPMYHPLISRARPKCAKLYQIKTEPTD